MPEDDDADTIDPLYPLDRVPPEASGGEVPLEDEDDDDEEEEEEEVPEG